MFPVLSLYDLMYDYDCVTLGMWWNWVMHEKLGRKISSWMLEIVEIKCCAFKNSSFYMLRM